MIYRNTIQTLTALIDGVQRPYGGYGICDYLYDNGDKLHFTVAYAIFRSWPKFSGIQNFPVPGDYLVSPQSAYNNNQRMKALWNKTCPSSVLRWELLTFVRDELIRLSQED